MITGNFARGLAHELAQKNVTHQRPDVGGLDYHYQLNHEIEITQPGTSRSQKQKRTQRRRDAKNTQRFFFAALSDFAALRDFFYFFAKI